VTGGLIDAELGELSGDLPTYLNRAGDVDRLLRLFADDRWLRRRVSPQTRHWENYGRDLELAWDALDRDLADRPGAVPECVRLAVIRSTLTTVEDLPASLVAAAVRTGYWSAERSLSTIDRLSHPAERAACCHRRPGRTKPPAGRVEADQARRSSYCRATGPDATRRDPPHVTDRPHGRRDRDAGDRPSLRVADAG
jgi:hypothetical protein